MSQENSDTKLTPAERAAAEALWKYHYGPGARIGPEVPCWEGEILALRSDRHPQSSPENNKSTEIPVKKGKKGVVDMVHSVYDRISRSSE